MPEDTPRKYKARFYAVTITLRKDATLGFLPPGRADEGAFNVVNLPFTITKITSSVDGPTNILGDAGANLANRDGQYRLEFKSDQHNYQNEPMLAQAFHGLGQGGYHTLPAPIPLPAKATMTVRVTNEIQREEDTKFQVIFHGVEPVVDDPGVPS